MPAVLQPTYEQLYDSVLRLLSTRAQSNAPQQAFLYDEFVKQAEQDIKSHAKNTAISEGGVAVQLNDAILSPENKNLVRFVVWQLIVTGVLIPGGEGGPRYQGTEELYRHNLPCFTLTRFGIDSLKAGSIQPFDPTGYGKRVSELSSIPEAAKDYARESVSCFHRGEFLASLTTTGIANELVLHELYHAFQNAIDDTNMKTKLNDNANKSIKTKSEILQQILDQKKDQLPPNVREKAVMHIQTMWNTIRITRNDAMHPVGPKDVDRAFVLAQLALFTSVASHINEVMNHLVNNRIK